jgi:hypothetical protein
LSGSLIALAFIGQMSELGTAFYVFALVLLPALSFIALVTFQRMAQITSEDIAYGSESPACASSMWTSLRSWSPT